MKRKIILNLAISLDGYIAREDGSYDWIEGHGDNDLDTEKKWYFNKFLEDIDVVVMGKTCYDQNMHEEYKNKSVYVATSKEMQDYDNVKFVNGDIVGAIETELKNDGKDVFLFGGGIIIDSFMKADVIDEYVIGIIPTILGEGKPLFLGNNPMVNLHLDEQIVEDGIVILKYSRR